MLRGEAILWAGRGYGCSIFGLAVATLAKTGAALVKLLLHPMETISLPRIAGHRLTRQSRRQARGGVGAKTERVERSIRELIASGQLGPGGRLPSERQLAQQPDVGRTTIRLILMKLATEGMVRSEHKHGYFVTGTSDGDRDSVSEWRG